MKVDFAHILAFAQRAAVAYDDDLKIRASSANPIEISELKDLKIKYFVETDAARELMWIAVRGTDNLKNALVDGEYLKDKDARLGVYLDRGFQVAAEEVYGRERSKLTPGFRIHVTGHSLGGAAAAILQAYLLADGFQVEAVTLGQPKVTNEDGVKKLRGDRLTRIIDAEDVVPLLPPATLLSRIHGRYRHFGPEVILEEPPHYRTLPEHASEGVDVTSFWEHLSHESVSDHHCAKYLKKIEQLAQDQRDAARSTT